MKTETKIILGMMAGSGGFKIKEFGKTFQLSAFNSVRNTFHTEWGEHENIIDLCTIQAHKSIKPLFSFNYLLSLLSSGFLPEVIAEKLEQDGIKIEWI